MCRLWNKAKTNLTSTVQRCTRPVSYQDHVQILLCSIYVAQDVAYRCYTDKMLVNFTQFVDNSVISHALYTIYCFFLLPNLHTLTYNIRITRRQKLRHNVLRTRDRSTSGGRHLDDVTLPVSERMRRRWFAVRRLATAMSNCYEFSWILSYVSPHTATAFSGRTRL